MTLLLVGHDHIKSYIISAHISHWMKSNTKQHFFQVTDIWWIDTWMTKTASKRYSATTAKEPVLKIIAHAHEISWKALAWTRFYKGLRERWGALYWKGCDGQAETKDTCRSPPGIRSVQEGALTPSEFGGLPSFSQLCSWARLPDFPTTATLKISQKQKMLILEHNLVCSRWEKIILLCLPADPWTPPAMFLQETRMPAPPASLCVKEGQIPVPRTPLCTRTQMTRSGPGLCRHGMIIFVLCNKLALSFFRRCVISLSSLAATRYDGCYGKPFSLNGKVLNARNALDRCTGIFLFLYCNSFLVCLF